MDYPLAKALKDAGFFQEGRGTRVAPPDKIVARRDDFAYVPTLEELIAACGDTFTKLVRMESKRGDWFAFGEGAEFVGKNPLEAVARLWLALNEKGAAT